MTGLASDLRAYTSYREKITYLQKMTTELHKKYLNRCLQDLLNQLSLSSPIRNNALAQSLKTAPHTEQELYRFLPVLSSPPGHWDRCRSCHKLKILFKCNLQTNICWKCYFYSYHPVFRGAYRETVKSDHDRAFPFLFQEIGALKGFASSEEKRKSVGGRGKMTASQAGKLSFDRREKGFFCGVGKENVFEQRNPTAMKRSDVWRIWENDADLTERQTCKEGLE